MPSLVSHQLSIIKYVVLKKIFFFLCFDRLIWTWTCLGLDKGGLDYSPNAITAHFFMNTERAWGFNIHQQAPLQMSSIIIFIF